MAPRKAKKKARQSRTWKDIDQDVKAKSMSSTALKRMLLGRCKKAAIFLVLAVALALGARAFLMTEDVSSVLSKAGRSLPIKSIETESDALGHEWILDYLDLNGEGLDLLGIDLAEMKQRLESYPQIVSADLARQFPDTLFITIEEREPVAKVFAADIERGRVTLLVDGEGVVYEGFGYDSKRVKALPSLDGIRLKRKDGVFEPIDGMEMVAKLLSEAQSIAPHLYRSWRVVSLAESPNILVKSRFAREMIFEPSPNSFRRQLAELDYIIDYHKGRSLSRVDKVDLTLQTQVPVTRASVVQ